MPDVASARLLELSELPAHLAAAASSAVPVVTRSHAGSVSFFGYSGLSRPASAAPSLTTSALAQADLPALFKAAHDKIVGAVAVATGISPRGSAEVSPTAPTGAGTAGSPHVSAIPASTSASKALGDVSLPAAKSSTSDPAVGGALAAARMHRAQTTPGQIGVGAGGGHHSKDSVDSTVERTLNSADVSDNRLVVLELNLRDHWLNRFMFNDATGLVEPNDVFRNDVWFVAPLQRYVLRLECRLACLTRVSEI